MRSFSVSGKYYPSNEIEEKGAGRRRRRERHSPAFNIFTPLCLLRGAYLSQCLKHNPADSCVILSRTIKELFRFFPPDSFIKRNGTRRVAPFHLFSFFVLFFAI